MWKTRCVSDAEALAVAVRQLAVAVNDWRSHSRRESLAGLIDQARQLRVCLQATGHQPVLRWLDGLLDELVGENPEFAINPEANPLHCVMRAD